MNTVKKYSKHASFTAIIVAALWFWVGHEHIFSDPYSTIVEAKDGTLLGAQIASDGQWRFPLIDSVPNYFKLAITTFEDKRFYKHPGVDILAIGRAVIGNITAGKVLSGASTLTMQTIRLSRKGKARSLWQKIIEASHSLRLECHADKEEILRMYATHAPFGGNVVGLETASWRYFNKTPSKLSLAESCMLAVLPNAPSLINLGKNRTKLLEKRNKLLGQLLENERIDSITYELSLLEIIPEAPFPLPRHAPHLLTYLQKSTTDQHRHSTTVDRGIQTMISEIADFHHEDFTQSGIENLAIVVLDTWTGEVLGYLGNAPNTQSEHAVDMIQAKRSSGSILKPFLYAHMIDDGMLSPQSLVQDVPTQIQGFRPRNYDRSYTGVIPADLALSRSLNVPAVRMLQEYKVDRFINDLKRLGLTSIDKSADHYGLSLILGGGEVKLWDLVGAYASLGRVVSRFNKDMSKYAKDDMLAPSLKKRTIDSSTLYRPNNLSAGAIYHTFQAMEVVKRPDEEGNWTSFNSRGKIAWKTGTSYGHRDAWAVGLTKRYTVGVWVGNADGEGVNGLVGVRKAAPVLFDVFNRLSGDAYFDRPLDDLQSINICKKSGFVAGQYCDHVDTMELANKVLEAPSCPYHQIIHTNRNGKRVHQGCSEEKVESNSWFVLPPIEEYYYKGKHPEYLCLPAYSEDCEGQVDQNPIDFIYPDRSTQIYIPKDIDGKKEKIIAQATHKAAEALLFWHLDDEYLGSTSELHSMDFFAEVGKHTLMVVDEEGHEARQTFSVIGE